MGSLRPWPRLMTPALAAEYCCMSLSAFLRRCPVPPMDLGDRRLDRFDKNDLDEWIEALKAPKATGVKSVAEALAEFQRENRRAREAS